MRYLQLDQGESVDKDEIIGIFDIDTASVSRDTRGALKRISGSFGTVNLCSDLPKRAYISGLSVESVVKRIQNPGFGIEKD